MARYGFIPSSSQSQDLPFPSLINLNAILTAAPTPPHTNFPFQLMRVIALAEELQAKAAGEAVAAAAAVVAAAALSEGPSDALPEVVKRCPGRPQSASLLGPSSAALLGLPNSNTAALLRSQLEVERATAAALGGPSSAALDQSQNTAVLWTLRSQLKRERAAAVALAVQVAAERAELEAKLAEATAGREAAEQRLRDQAAAHQLRDQAAAQQLRDQAAAQQLRDQAAAHKRKMSSLKAGLRAHRDLMHRQDRVCEALWARCGQLLSRGAEAEVSATLSGPGV